MQLVMDRELPQSVYWALDQLRQVLRLKGETIQESTAPEPGPAIFVGMAGQSPAVDRALDAAGVLCPTPAESLVIHPSGHDRLIITGRDERGLVYALTEVARAVERSTRHDWFDSVIPAIESPELSWRSMQLFLCNRALEEEWFYRERFWEEYLTQLARDRFNNLTLTFGHQTSYLSPPYPFLLEMPEFPQVRPIGFTQEARRQNLETLKKTSEMARARGLHFTFAVWSQHAYRYGTPMVEGLREDNLSDFNALGLRKVLEACPAIDGVQFRMNVESGVPEDRQTEFYEKQFRAIAECGRPIRLDLRAKGLANQTIQRARELVPSTVVSTKHWCEHLGMPYPMPAIQQFDRHHYRRYGMWDLLEKPRDCPLVYRLWSAGTQRVLLWGDPEWVKRFVVSCHFGSIGFEVMAPLTNKGALAETGRWPIIEDRTYQPYDEEYQRYWMFYLLFGRLGYNPETPAEIWRRELRDRFAEAAEAVEHAYHVGSQILPLITTVLQWSASLWRFWPEMFAGRNLEEDIQIEPSDPTQFYGVAEYVEDALKDRLCGKWTPGQVAHHLQQLAAQTRNALASVRSTGPVSEKAELGGTELDFTLVAHLADYHACRLLAATHMAFYLRTGETARLQEARRVLCRAKAHWSALAAVADGIYHPNLIFGRRDADHCGHWKDCLPVVEQDIARVEQILTDSPDTTPAASDKRYPGEHIPLEQPHVTFEPVNCATPGRDLTLQIHIQTRAPLHAVRCYYRTANQALSFNRLEMQANGNDSYIGTIPGGSIDAQWDMMVFFEIFPEDGRAFRWPDWRVRTPYIVIPTLAGSD